MGLLINMEAINIIQMLDACEVRAACMTEAFQRDEKFWTPSWGGAGSAWTFAFAVISFWRVNVTYSGRPSMIAKGGVRCFSWVRSSFVELKISYCISLFLCLSPTGA